MFSLVRNVILPINSNIPDGHLTESRHDCEEISRFQDSHYIGNSYECTGRLMEKVTTVFCNGFRIICTSIVDVLAYLFFNYAF